MLLCNKAKIKKMEKMEKRVKNNLNENNKLAKVFGLDIVLYLNLMMMD